MKFCAVVNYLEWTRKTEIAICGYSVSWEFLYIYHSDIAVLDIKHIMMGAHTNINDKYDQEAKKKINLQ